MKFSKVTFCFSNFNFIVPGEMERPTVQGINSSMVLVSWSPPRNPAGLLNYYEVAVIKVDSHNAKNHSITSNVTAIAYGKFYLCLTFNVSFDLFQPILIDSW